MTVHAAPRAPAGRSLFTPPRQRRAPPGFAPALSRAAPREASAPGRYGPDQLTDLGSTLRRYRFRRQARDRAVIVAALLAFALGVVYANGLDAAAWALRLLTTGI